ncbi:MAG: hypothetical protein JOZ78_22240 [Chroococcidiopsidaceae cyanobacterium CP_BM_ER_R8_30]|nr:hypothetical protein [Chroococcidiopsidaceae cyanobacterium CP_BM_ER_R8_30]
MTVGKQRSSAQRLHQRIDGELQRRIIIDLKGRILEAQHHDLQSRRRERSRCTRRCKRRSLQADRDSAVIKFRSSASCVVKSC